MTLTVQTLQGDVAGANSYATLELMKAFHAERGVDLSPHSDDRLSQALVLATDFLDSRYSFVGVPLDDLQGTACPRYLPEATVNDLLTTVQWTALTKACCMLAYRSIVRPAGLMPDPTLDATGQRVAKKTTKAGPVESSVEYVPTDPSALDANVPSYPMVDLLLKNVGLLKARASGGTLARA